MFRLRWPTFERLYERLLGFLMRESEKARVPLPLTLDYKLTSSTQKSTNGVIWYILGVNFALQFYPRDVATVAILMYVCYLCTIIMTNAHITAFHGPTQPHPQ